jgi:hypothetical protein
MAKLQLRHLWLILVAFSVSLSVFAQESAEATAELPLEPEPTIVSTETPFSTEVPEIIPTPTEDAPLPEPTPDALPTDIPTEAAPTEPPTVQPSPIVIPPTVDLVAPRQLIVETFDAFTGEGWELAGWSLGTVEGDAALIAESSPASAAFYNFLHSEFALTAQVSVSVGSTLRVQLSGVDLLLDAFGNSRLYQGDEVIATSPATMPPDGEADPYTVQITAQAGIVTVSVDGANTYITALDGLLAAPLRLEATLAEGGSAALHQLILEELAPLPVIDPAPAVTLPPMEPTLPTEPTLESPEATAEADADADIATEEPSEGDVDETSVPSTEEAPVVNNEAEVALFAPAAAPFLTSDFESDLVGWTTTGSIVAENDVNRVLLMAGDGLLAPTVDTTFLDVELVGRVRWLQPEATLTVTLGGRSAALSPAQLVITVDDTAEAHELALSADVWYPVRVALRPSGVEVNLGEASFTLESDAATSNYATFTITTTGAVMLDDIALTDFAPLTVETAPTASDKLTGSLSQLQEIVNTGDAAALAAFLAETSFVMDEAGRVRVEVFAVGYGALADVEAAVIAQGGVVAYVDDLAVHAYLAPESLLTVALRADVFMLRQWIGATSTSISAAPSTAPTGTFATEAFNYLGVQDWHENNILGQNVKIGVIDTGFGTGVAALAPPKSGEYACINASSVFKAHSDPASTSNHGRNVVEVLCDIAPSSTVFMYEANSYTSMANAINRARTVDNVDVLLITMDLGVHETLGDGTGRGGSDPYNELALARQAGIIVIAAAGNNGNPADIGVSGKAPRYAAITTSTDGSITVNVQITHGDIIRVNTSTGGFSVSGAVSFSDGPGAIGGSAPFSDSTNCSAAPCTRTITISDTTSGAIVQVQLVPVLTAEESSQTAAVFITSTSGGTPVANAGSLARPADSPDVITVGAVCAADGVGIDFVRLPDASVGPVYGPGGTPSSLPSMPPIGYSRNVIKPDFMAPSVVTTSIFDSGDPRQCDGTVNGLNNAAKFGGSSAAAAHAAGMTALLLSNTSGAGYNRFNRLLTFPDEVTDNVRFYFQTRSADLPVNNPNGFDMLHGAGIATLGNPKFNLNHATNPTTPPDGFTCTGTIHYVGQANRNSGGTGTITDPFFSIGLALRQAAANDCIVVHPGEYTTPIVATGLANNITLISYDGASDLPALGTIIRITGQTYHPTEPNFEVSGFGITKRFERVAGLYIRSVNGLTVEGFAFIPAANLLTLNDNIYAPQAIVIDNSSSITIRRNRIGTTTVNGISYQGWGRFNTVTQTWQGPEATPMIVIQSTNVNIEENVFRGNAVDGGGFDYVSGALAVVSSNVTIRRNEFLENRNLTFDFFDFSPIVLIEESTAAIVANAFSGNSANTIIQARTTAQDSTLPTRIVSNVFLNNAGFAAPNPDPFSPLSDVAGGLISLYFTPHIYVVNNTMVENTFVGDLGAIVTRGVPDQNVLTGNPTSASYQTLNFHNNLVHNNTFQRGILRYSSVSGACNPNPSTATSAITFNWFSQTIVTGPGTGSCASEVTVANNNRLASALIFSDFGGFNANLLSTDWRYWSLAQNAKTQANAIDNGGNIGQFGVPMADANNYAAPFNVDAFGRRRSTSSLGPATAPTDTDIGAFEFTELLIDDLDCDGNGRRNVYSVTGIQEDDFPGGLPYIVIDLECDPPGPEGMTSFIQGAAGSITLAIPNTGTFDEDGPSGPILPITYNNVRNWSTRCGDQFEGTRGVIALTTNTGSGRLLYCPPEHFYNQGISDPDAAIEIFYVVSDEADASATGKVEITINPTADLPLTASIGDDNPPGDILEITMLANTSATLPLRPFVTFGNFEWSEAENPEFNPTTPVAGAMADYPFTLSSPTILSDPRSVIAGTPTIVSNQLQVTSTNNRGTAIIQYTVTDANGFSTVNTVRVRVRSVIPNEPGLYDDSSIYWRYENAQPSPQVGTFRWQAVGNPRAINNTLHQSNGSGDRAIFQMIGTGFVLYMQGTGSQGAQYKIIVNGVETSTWTYAFGTTATSNPPISTATIDLGAASAGTGVLTCYAGARNVVLTGNVLTRFLSNNMPVPYTVMCNGTANQQLEVVIENGSSNGPTLAVDAFGLLDDATAVTNPGPFGPGTYDFDNAEMRNIFASKANWAEVRAPQLTRAIGFRALDGADSVSFRINGATGFAIGTTLMPAGAEFRLCVRDVVSNDDLCQLVDTSPLGTATPLAYNAYVPWYGLNDDREYEVTISSIVRPSLPTTLTNLGTLVFDGLVVFGPQHNMNGTLPNGTTENDQLVDFAYLGGIEDSWVHAFNVAAASNQSLSTTTATHAGPFLAFRIAADADYFLYDFNNTNNLTRQLMICVDRHVLTAAANDFGRCIVVDTRAGTYRQVLADGTLSPTNGTGNIRPTRGTLLISDDLFVGGWPNVNPTPGYHQVEIFSLINEPFNFDRVTVYGAGVLPPGIHEEFSAAMLYYDNTDTLMTPGVFNPRDPVLNFNAPTTAANTFLFVNDNTATRDSSGSVAWTKQVGASIVFGVDGDGFIPRFRLERQSDAVSICWLRTSGPLPLPSVIRSTGTCAIYENFSTGLLFNQMRPITGLDNTIGSPDYYAVAVTNLGDNLTPVKINAPYINMWFDGVTVLNDEWQSLTPLTPGTVFETSFVNRVAQNRFAYSPTVWSTVNGPVAQFSGGAYDISRNILGASVTFRTNGADAVRFRRNLGGGQALLQFCAALETTPNNRRCVVVNNAGSGVGHHINVLLNENGNTAPHVVSITALTAGNFILDTIEPVVNTTPLTAGIHDDNAVGISYYGGASTNLVTNGNVESFDQVGTLRTPTAWTVVGGLPAANFTSGAPAFNGSLAAAAVVTADGQGIRTAPFNLSSGRTYVFTARVMIDGSAGSVEANLVDSSNNIIGSFSTQTLNFISSRQYQVMFVQYTAPSNLSDVSVRFIGNGLQPTIPTNLASRRFLVDEVGVFEVGQADWETVANNNVFGRYVMRSIQPGAEAQFSFTGTGVRIGMVLDSLAGSVEICLSTVPSFTASDCILYENERSAATTRVSRTFAGLLMGTYFVRIRDAEDGTTALTVGNPSRPRTAPMGRVAIDFVEVLDDPLPPTILTDVTANETFQISGVNALQLLPTNGWLYRSAPNLTAFSGNSNVAVADPNSGAVSSVIAGHVGVMQLDLSHGATIVIYSDAPNANKADLLYCVDGQDGEIAFNPLTRRYTISGSTRCGVTSALATSSQAVLVLPSAAANSTLTFTALAPAPLLIDGYQVLLGTQLAPGYYETSLSESGTCVGALSNNGCVGSTSSDVFRADTPANWFRQSNAAFSGGTSLVLADSSGAVGAATGSPRTGAASRLTFQIENATGFSLITTTNPLGGTFSVTAVGANTFSFTGTTQSTGTFNRVSIPFTGLPLGSYTVTIENTNAVNLYVDAVEVYGELYALGSLYDDSARDLDGNLLITYGPSINTWSRVEGAAAATSLNRTFHVATAAGAVAMFEVGENDPATGIKIYASSPTAATAVQVCWKNLATPASAQQCGSLLNLTAGRATQTFTSAGHYAVSIINTLNQRLQLDAVQVIEAGGLTEGIYTVQELRDDTNANFNGTWTFNNPTNATTATRTAPASNFTFTMKGIGFSILLNETSTSASPYTLCVTRTTACDTLNETITRIPAPNATQPYALTVVGLHNASGQNETYTVTLSSTDTRPLVVSGLHILGAKPATFRLNATNPRAEDDDPRLRTLPFDWTVLTVNRTGNVSGDSQAIGTRRGGVFYFEFAGSFPAVEYVRQISTTFSNVDICFGPIGSTASLWANHTTNCVSVDNKEANAFGRATVASTALTCTTGCWVIVRPSEDRQVALDLVRLVSPDEPLRAGLYEENFPGLRNFKQTSPTTYDISANADDLLGMNILPRVTATGASGTFIRRYIAADAGPNTSALNGGLYFTMEGTGFSVGFVNDPFQDEVRICYLRYTGPEPTVQTVLTTGRCQTFDNQSSATAFRVNRSILGLPRALYAVVVQMRPDNGIPAVHAANQLPLRMDIDTVTVYDDIWFANNQSNWLDDTHTTAITPAMGRVETNVNNRTTDRRVQFFGAWSNVANARYSGGRYDLTSSAGAGILFRTANANTITLFTALGNAFTDVIICATPLNLNPLTQSGPTSCVEQTLRGSGFQQAINFTLGDAVDEYVVTITTTRNAQFHLDAIQVFDSTVALTPGFYESNDARIRYNRAYQNFVPNGDFEVTNSARVPLNWTTVGSLTSFTTVNSTVISGTKYASFSGGLNTGIRSETFTVPTTGTYPIAAYVLLTRGTAQVRLRENTLTGVVTLETFSLTRAGNVWQVYRDQVELTAGGEYFIEIIATSSQTTVGVDAVQVNSGGLWTTEFNNTYSGGSLRRSLTAGASVTFNFTGTGFALGMLVDRSGGKTEVCYGVGTPTNCFVYQNELAAPSARVSRVIAGLPLNTYVVRIREVDDGFSTLVANNPQALRPNTNVVSRVALDTVEIFGATTFAALPVGSFNENATNPSGVPYFRFFPEERFRAITGNPAAAYSDASFVAVTENNGAISNNFAGPSMVFNISKQAGRSATLIFTLGPANNSRSTQILICAGNNINGAIAWDGVAFRTANAGTPGSCTLRTTARTDRELIVNAADLSALGTATSGTIRVSITALVPGRFEIDGVTYLQGDALPAGVNDDFLAAPLTNSITAQNAALLKFAVGSNFGVNRDTRNFAPSVPTGCRPTEQWCLLRNNSYFGTTAAYTRANGATLGFNIEGTGFGLMVQTEANAGDLRICYKRAANQTAFPALGAETDPEDVVLNTNTALGIYCERVRLNTATTGGSPWQGLNPTLINPNASFRYTFAYYGLPQGRYTMEVRTILPVVNPGRVVIDAINVFSNPTTLPPLQPGLHDDNVPSIRYEPSLAWARQTTPAQPPAGAYGRAEAITRLAGSVAQLRVEGNSVTFFQSLTGGSSRHVNLCLLITSAGGNPGNVHCSTTSQTAQRPSVQQAWWTQTGTGRMSPVMIYGLGEGVHTLIIENRDHNRPLSIDAIAVQP